MKHQCPYIARIDHRAAADRYGNPREEVTLWASVPMNPRAKGYDPERADQVLRAARGQKSAHPDAEVSIKEAPLAMTLSERSAVAAQ